MWNCERTRAYNQPETIEDVDLEFQTGSEADRIGTASVEIAHLKDKAGERLGSLALFGGIKSIELHDTGFTINGELVEISTNGFIETYHRIAETWDLTVVPNAE